jgi:hypothetical protein
LFIEAAGCARDGIVDVIEPDMSDDGLQAVRRSAETIRKAEMHQAP